jgi:hypothetical protein
VCGLSIYTVVGTYARWQEYGSWSPDGEISVVAIIVYSAPLFCEFLLILSNPYR